LGKRKETQHLIIHYQHDYQIQSDYLHPNLLYKHYPAHSDENRHLVILKCSSATVIAYAPDSAISTQVDPATLQPHHSIAEQYPITLYPAIAYPPLEFQSVAHSDFAPLE
jgi:hypothetical protein